MMILSCNLGDDEPGVAPCQLSPPRPNIVGQRATPAWASGLLPMFLIKSITTCFRGRNGAVGKVVARGRITTEPDDTIDPEKADAVLAAETDPGDERSCVGRRDRRSFRAGGASAADRAKAPRGAR